VSTFTDAVKCQQPSSEGFSALSDLRGERPRTLHHLDPSTDSAPWLKSVADGTTALGRVLGALVETPICCFAHLRTPPADATPTRNHSIHPTPFSGPNFPTRPPTPMNDPQAWHRSAPHSTQAGTLFRVSIIASAPVVITTNALPSGWTQPFLGRLRRRWGSTRAVENPTPNCIFGAQRAARRAQWECQKDGVAACWPEKLGRCGLAEGKRQ
jgi:hypothetical protein